MADDGRNGGTEGGDPVGGPRGSETAPAGSVAAALDRAPADRTTLAVLGVVVAALALRLYRLGARVMHWDEGRVGYWILRYHETGQFHYRPIIHGPFLPVVNDYVFTILPPTDFSARLVVALVGGLLPLVALLLRDRLRDTETVALALVLALNPLLVYYSRFMRNDVLVGAFALTALGFAVRGLDRGSVRPAYVAAVALALAFTAKENALVYVACFLGAAVLLLDHRLLRRTAAGDAVRSVGREWVGAAADRVRRPGSPLSGFGAALAHAVALPLAFLAVVTFFYAPRPDLWTALASPAALPGVVEAAIVGSGGDFYGMWVAGSHENPYVPFLYDYLETLAYGAPAVLAFAAVGFVADGYGGEGGGRDLVAFATYWGAVSVLGYPVATDIRAPWAVVHAVVPLTVPAAVGLAHVYRRASLALVPDREDAVGPALAALLVLAAATGVAGANGAYMNSASEADGEVLQYAQPGNDLKATLAEVERAVERTDEGSGPDVLFVGTTHPRGGGTLLYVANESSADQPPAGGPSWHSRLPLPWYLERYGAEVTSTAPDEPLPDDPPPVVIAYEWDREEVRQRLGDGYLVREHRFRLWSERIVVFVDRSALR